MTLKKTIALLISLAIVPLITTSYAQTTSGQEDTHQETVNANDAINNFVISGLVESHYDSWPQVSVSELTKLKIINDNSLGMSGLDDLLTPDVAQFHDDFWVNGNGLGSGDKDVYIAFHVSEQSKDSIIREKLTTLYSGINFEIEYIDPVLDATLEPSDPQISLDTTATSYSGYLPPLQQINNGIDPEDIQCNAELVHVLRANDGHACVKETTAKKLNWEIALAVETASDTPTINDSVFLQSNDNEFVEFNVLSSEEFILDEREIKRVLQRAPAPWLWYETIMDSEITPNDIGPDNLVQLPTTAHEKYSVKPNIGLYIEGDSEIEIFGPLLISK